LTQIVYDGKTWTKQKNGYYQATIRTHQGKNWLHQYVYEKEIGPQPKGMDIHHKDHNKDNNATSNLTLINAQDHSSWHSKIYFATGDNYQKQIAHLNRVRPTKVWPDDPIKREEHRQALIAGMADIKPVDRECLNCGSKYSVLPIGKSKFCSNKCKSAWRRNSEVDNEHRNCQACGKYFTVNKYSKKITCSRSCGNVIRGRTMRNAK
jgi:hypothetical protein